MKTNNRRNFIKVSGLVVSTMLVRCKSGVAIAKEDPRKLIDSSNPTAKALKYVPGAKDAADRKNKNAFCENCQYFTSEEKLNGKAVGKCQIIPGGLVLANGWCVSWVEKRKT